VSPEQQPPTVDDELLRRLLGEAAAARVRSYAPYSKFRAGAAVATDGGSVVQGVIVENVSLGLAMCAERVAMFAAIARGERPTALALVAPDTQDELTWPCGACLQIALELGGPDMVVTARSASGDDDEELITSRVRDLVPRAPHRSHRSSPASS
jgi:cytidine deaminase